MAIKFKVGHRHSGGLHLAFCQKPQHLLHQLDGDLLAEGGLGGRLWQSLSAFLSAILSGFTLLSAFLSAQKSKTTQKRALKSKYAFLSAQKRAQTSGFAQKSAQLRSFAQKRAQLSGPLKKGLKRGEE